MLAAEGLVTMKLRRGAYVTEVSEQDLREVYELLALLEADAAAAACSRASAEQLQQLQDLHQQLEVAADAQTGSRERFFALNEAFHRQLLDISGNRWRAQVVSDLRQVMKLKRHGSLLREGRLHESLLEHRALMAALEQRDADAARSLMAQHFEHGMQAAI